MNGRRFSLALLLALAGCAVVAQGAVAQVGTQAVNTTAVTCVKGGSGEEFKDPHCTEYVGTEKGEYGHVSISNGTTTELAVTNVGSVKINATLAGVNTEVICSKAASVAGNSFLENVETSGKHTVFGLVQITLSSCEVIKPAKCIVTDIVLTSNFVGVEGLNGKGEMGIEFTGVPFEKDFAGLTFHDKGAEKCSLNNMTKPFTLKGSAIATGKVAPTAQYGGATWVFEDANEMQTLEAGLKKASFAATFTVSMSGGGNPIALTTTT
jgi:hypothetical protein